MKNCCLGHEKAPLWHLRLSYLEDNEQIERVELLGPFDNRAAAINHRDTVLEHHKLKDIDIELILR